MSYAFRPSRRIGEEVKRIADKQLALAVEQLRIVGESWSDEAIHEARRHVKKIRALIRLVQPSLGDISRPIEKRMRTAARMLAPVADGRAAVETIERLKTKSGAHLPLQTLAAIRGVLAKRSARIDRKTRLDRIPARVAGMLAAERRRVELWDLNASGFRAIQPGLERCWRRARRAMERTALEPTSENCHAWRRRVKDLWFQIRLIEPRCGGSLGDIRRRLEALDGLLGEYHNVVLVEQVLTNEALVSRAQAAHCLHALHSAQTQLRHRAMTIGRAVFDEKPRRFVRRVRALWKAAGARQQREELRASWPRAA